jgi:hypothetical protein
MSNITVHGALLQIALRALKLRNESSIGSQLHSALETLNNEVDIWAASGDGLQTLVKSDKQSSFTVSDQLVRAAMLVAARRVDAPVDTALRNALEQLAAELDSWAETGSRRRQRQASDIFSK